MLTVMGIGLAFGSINKEPVAVDYFVATLEWPLALWLALFFFTGTLVGGIVTYLGTWWAVRRRIRAAKARAAAETRQSAAPGQPALTHSDTGND